MEKTTLEVIAPTVDEAIEKGMAQLGLSREEIDFEVLDAGSRGFLGLGNRQARVRISVKTAAGSIEKPAVSVSGGATAVVRKETQALMVEEEDVLEISRLVVEELLGKMRVRAKVTTKTVPSNDETGEPVVLVDIQGDDLSILIGRRSETLNALQYISSLIIGKQYGKWVPLLIDVQGYRQRRESQLRKLAQRMAEQAIQTGRRQSLEPMPAAERRIIHLELRDHPLVATESIGEDSNRKVTIYLKKKSS